MEDRGSDGSDLGLILVLKEYQTGFTKMRAGSLVLLLALKTGLTPEAQACHAVPRSSQHPWCWDHSSSVWAGQYSQQEA